MGNAPHQRPQPQPVRFFGGWDFEARDGNNRMPASVGYDKGVPMGGDLAARPDTAKALTTEEIKTLLVGKQVRVKNLLTGARGAQE